MELFVLKQPDADNDEKDSAVVVVDDDDDNNNEILLIHIVCFAPLVLENKFKYCLALFLKLICSSQT